jgi:hypothetical protein
VSHNRGDKCEFCVPAGRWRRLQRAGRIAYGDVGPTLRNSIPAEVGVMTRKTEQLQMLALLWYKMPSSL